MSKAVAVIPLVTGYGCCVRVAECEEKNLHAERKEECCFASDQCETLRGFHTHPHLCGGSPCFLTVSVTSR